MNHFLNAAYIGPNIPLGDYPIRIHSIFRSTINLQILSTTQPNKNLINTKCDTLKKLNIITIVNNNLGDYPQSIRLTTNENFSSYDINVTSNGFINTDCINIKYNNNKILHITLTHARHLCYKPLKLLKIDSNWQICINLLINIQYQAKTDLNIETIINESLNGQNRVDNHIVKTIRHIENALYTHDIHNLPKSIQNIIGLGIGLTPSGDDFLCGFLVAAYCSHNTNIDLLLNFQCTLQHYLPNTNLISAMFIRFAIQKKITGKLYNFILSLHKKNNFRNKLVKLCNMGHSSGMDIATGFLYGLKIWNQIT